MEKEIRCSSGGRVAGKYISLLTLIKHPKEIAKRPARERERENGKLIFGIDNWNFARSGKKFAKAAC